MSGRDANVRLPIAERVLEANDEIAAGSGRSWRAGASLRSTSSARRGAARRPSWRPHCARLSGRRRPAVLVGDLATRRDGDRLARWCDRVVQISTGEGCHLEAGQVRDALWEAWTSRAWTCSSSRTSATDLPGRLRPGPERQGGPVQPDRGRRQGRQASVPGHGRGSDPAQQDRSGAVPVLRSCRFEADVRLLNPTRADPRSLCDDRRRAGGVARLAGPGRRQSAWRKRDVTNLGRIRTEPSGTPG
jgi:hypothetical protein